MKRAASISLLLVLTVFVGMVHDVFAHQQTWATPRVLRTSVRSRTLTITAEVMVPTPCTTVEKKVTHPGSRDHVLSVWGEAQKGNCVTMIAYDTVNVSLKLRVRGTHSVVIQGRKADGSVTKDSTLTVRVK
ncbi:MAG: hypothetical protein JSS89_03770 [Bacteroidetes bacterium]|nr:hypothetical protein [Bacteroidota bacterium]